MLASKTRFGHRSGQAGAVMLRQNGERQLHVVLLMMNLQERANNLEFAVAVSLLFFQQLSFTFCLKGFWGYCSYQLNV